MEEVIASPFSTAELPIGIVDPEQGRWLRKYTLRELTASDLRLIHDEDLIRATPVDWMGRIAALSLADFEGIPVYQNYQHGEFKVLPPIVSRMPMQDVIYLSVASHVHTYGPIIDDMRITCPSCRRPSTQQVDLRQLTITRLTKPPMPLTIDLATGFKYEGELPGLTGRVMKTYIFHIPTIKDYAQHQSKMVTSQRKQMSDVNTYVLLSALDDVLLSDGDELPPEHRLMLGLRLLDELKAPDYFKVNRIINDLPGVDRTITFTCPNPMCKTEVEVGVNQSSFYPKG